MLPHQLLVTMTRGEAARLRVSVSCVSKVLSRRRQTGQTCALPQRNHVPPKLAGLCEAIQDEVKAHPDATIEELRAWLRQAARRFRESAWWRPPWPNSG
jgi:transposase